MKTGNYFGLPVRRPLFLLALCLCLTTFTLHAQQREPEKKVEDDGFVWYMVYNPKGFIALDANKKEIIPVSRGYGHGTQYEEEYGCFRIVKYYDGAGPYYGLCDKNGKEIIEPGRKYSGFFWSEAKGYYVVKKRPYTGLCKKDGTEIISPDRGYTMLLSCPVGFRVEAGDYAGLCDKDGKELISPKQGYNVVLPHVYDNGSYRYFKVKKNNLTGICDYNGKEIVPPRWQDVTWDDQDKCYKGRKSRDSKLVPIDLANPYPPR